VILSRRHVCAAEGAERLHHAFGSELIDERRKLGTRRARQRSGSGTGSF